MSQRHEGWCVIANPYDDGGFSGGTLERPALQSLLADIDAGKVDVVVVYKIDRLTRSLFDFAKIVETFDASAPEEIERMVHHPPQTRGQRQFTLCQLPKAHTLFDGPAVCSFLVLPSVAIKRQYARS